MLQSLPSNPGTSKGLKTPKPSLESTGLTLTLQLPNMHVLPLILVPVSTCAKAGAEAIIISTAATTTAASDLSVLKVGPFLVSLLSLLTSTPLRNLKTRFIETPFFSAFLVNNHNILWLVYHYTECSR
jgi:hypothetical protein